MAVYGYIMVEGDIWRVTVQRDHGLRTVKRRSSGMMGSYLSQIHTALARRENEPLIEDLRWSKQVALPMIKP